MPPCLTWLPETNRRHNPSPGKALALARLSSDWNRPGILKQVIICGERKKHFYLGLLAGLPYGKLNQTFVL